MSSLYDQYYSETNINHIYKILCDLISKEKKINLHDNQNNINIFKQKMDFVFKNSRNYKIEEVNKELLTHTLEYFLENLKEEKKEEAIDFMSEYDKFMNERENTDLSIKNQDEDKPIENVIKEDNSIKVEKVKKSKKGKKNIVVSSKDRINKDSNRFNYKIKYPEENIKEIVSIIIPIEDCILFTTPILNLEIEELDLNILMTCENVIEMNNYKYGIYKASKNIINKKSDVLSINISSIYGNEEYDSDIVDIKLDGNIINLEDSEDYNKNDILILSDKDKIEFCKIIDKKGNKLELEDCVIFEDGDNLSILNSNLQNTIIFN
tara:strand:- start:7424 stop:8389 length:966 start_codon:yes stop_codon:yes gene_type:complete